MITVTEKESGLSHYIFEDDIMFAPDECGIDTTAGFRIGHLNTNTGMIYKDVTPPVDWEARKYTYDGNTWELAPYPDQQLLEEPIDSLDGEL